MNIEENYNTYLEVINNIKKKKYLDIIPRLITLSKISKFRKRAMLLLCKAYFYSHQYSEVIKQKKILDNFNQESIYINYFCGLSMFFEGLSGFCYLLEKARKHGIYSSQSLSIEAYALFKQKKYHEAIQIYLKIKNEGRIGVTTLLNVGNIYMKIDKPECAYFYFKKALKADPKNLFCNIRLVESLISLNKLNEAKKALLKILSLRPNPTIIPDIQVYKVLISN